MYTTRLTCKTQNDQIKKPHAITSKAFSLVPLLLTGQSISVDARRALRENRMRDAADLIMHDYGLSCSEAGDLLNIRAY